MNRTSRSFRFLLACLAGMAAAGSLTAQVQLLVNPTAVALSSQAGNPVPVTQSIALSSSGDAVGNHLSYTAFVQNISPAGSVWFSITGSASGVTPGKLTVSALAASPNIAPLPEGIYTAQLLIEAAGNATDNPVVIPVTFTVAQIAAAPGSLSFSYQAGGLMPQPQTVLVSGLAGVPVGFLASVSVSSGGNWLEVAPTSATTPATVTAGLNPAVITSLPAGTYNGAMVLAVAGDSTVLSVPVVLTVSATPQVTTSPTSMTFNYQAEGTNNTTQQNLEVTSGGTPVAFQAMALSAPNPAGIQWLVLSNNTSTVTPATLTVGVSPGILPAGSYAGQVNIVVGGVVAVTVNVSLIISQNPLISLTPGSLNFTYQIGGAVPAAQSIATASTGAALPYSPITATSSGGDWLDVNSGSTTPNPILVSVNPAGLGAGVYTGQVIVSATNAANSPQQVPVTLTVTDYALVEASPSSLTFVYQVGQTTPGAPVVDVTSSTGETLGFSFAPATNTGGNWLDTFFVNASPTTPGSFRVAVTPNLAPGTYTGDVNITAINPAGVPVPNSPLPVPVTFYVSNDPLLIVNPYSLTFSTTLGGQTPAQTITLTSTSDPLNYTITANGGNAGPWLAVATQPGQTPSSILVDALVGNLSAGTYQGSITIAATNPSGAAVADSPVVIPVTFQVVEGILSASPLSLTFSQTLGGTPPSSQTIKVTGTGPQALAVNVAATTNSGVNWLSVTPSTGNTPVTLTVSVDGSKLSPGTYIGTITISAPNAAGSPQTIQVTLTVAAQPTISLAPASLQFSSQVGGAAPAAQSIAVAASSGSLPFTAAATVTGNSGNWLSVSPASGTSPANLTVTVNPAGLAPGTYTGTITVTSAGAANSPQSTAVTLTVAEPATPVPTSVMNAASQIPGAVAPGEIISIYGTNLGPATGAGGVISNNSLETTISGVQVTFGNIAAPLLYVSATQINAIVPFELAGQLQTHMEVSNNGAVSAALDLAVAAAAPALFTLTENGSGQGAIINATGGVNGASNPAPQGSIIVLYATGGGETSPAGVTGNITPSDGTGLKTVPGVSVTVAGLTCKVWYAGSAPGFVEGALQINAQLPPHVPSGAQPVVLTVDGASSQAGTTVVVQ